MKNTIYRLNRNRLRVAAAVAIASVPVSVLALSGTYLEISELASIGYNVIFSSSSSTSNGTPALFVGDYNASSFTSNSTDAGGLAVGSFCVIRDPGSVVIGKWNKDTLGDELLILANGTDQAPNNVLEVFKNGAIRIIPQGDINMGNYQ
jgi:hypothetical protein